MNRRKLIKQLVIASGGLITLPPWMISCGISDNNIHSTSFSTADQNLLAGIADTILPAGNSVGALSVGVDKFLLKLIDDCYEKEVQENVKLQLKKLESSARTNHKKPFRECDQNSREQLLLKLSSSANKSEKDFFTLIKTETIRGFNTAQKVMEEFQGYKVAPGHYYGCVNVKLN